MRPADPTSPPTVPEIIAQVRHRLVGKLSHAEIGCPIHGKQRVMVIACVGCQRQAVLDIAVSIIDDPGTYLGIGNTRAKDLATESPKYPGFTVNGAIERCTDMRRLRTLAIQLREALVGQHQVIDHLINDFCEDCGRAAELGDPTHACRLYRGRQRQYLDAINAI